jgi:hypothetical protein
MSGCNIAHSPQATREPLNCSERNDVCGTLRVVERFYRLKMPRKASLASSWSIPSASVVHFRAIDNACVRRFSGIWTDFPSARLLLAYTRHRADVSMAASPLWKAGARGTLCHRRRTMMESSCSGLMFRTRPLGDRASDMRRDRSRSSFICVNRRQWYLAHSHWTGVHRAISKTRCDFKMSKITPTIRFT